MSGAVVGLKKHKSIEFSLKWLDHFRNSALNLTFFVLHTKHRHTASEK